MTQNSLSADTTTAQYHRAQTLMQGFWSRNIVANSTVFPRWIEGSDCFWYPKDIDNKTLNPGQPLSAWDKEYRLVNARQATNKRAFDHDILASALSEAAGQVVNSAQLPIKQLRLQLDTDDQLETLYFDAFDKAWRFDTKTQRVKALEKQPPLTHKLCSPDGKYQLFICDNNLHLSETSSGEERALTRDGTEDYCYAVKGLGQPGAGIQARWSNDARYVFTLVRDNRQVKTLPMVEHVPADNTVRPVLHNIKMALQGDDHIPEYRLMIIDISSGRIQPAHYPPIAMTRNCYSKGFFDINLGWWASNNKHAYFVEVARDYKTVRVVALTATTGATRVLFEETSPTQINLMLNADGNPHFVPLPESNELIWLSERSGWAHLYLYDLATGQLKQTLTSGDWLVKELVSFDHKRRELFLQTMGRNQGENPYYADLVRVNLDTAALTTVIASNDHYYAVSDLCEDFTAFQAGLYNPDIGASRSVSHSGQFAVVTRSRADTVPVSVLLDRDGQLLAEVEVGEISTLQAVVSDQWVWPEPVTVKAADGDTDIYGLIFRPSSFDEKKRYPVIDYAFTCADIPLTPRGSFSNNESFGRAYFEPAALAELGFMVVIIDGRGTPFRRKAFLDECYGWAESASNLADHVVGIQQLAKRYPCMDINRVGISSHIGGFAAVQGLLHYPEFYKVGVGANFYDSRLFPAAMWGDKFEGEGPQVDQHQYLESLADQLEGKLLMIQGMKDVITPPANTFRVIAALQKANKDVDLIALPSMGHGVNSYVIRRSWDYFVQHLLNVAPPEQFPLTTMRDL